MASDCGAASREEPETSIAKAMVGNRNIFFVMYMLVEGSALEEDLCGLQRLAQGIVDAGHKSW
jgi:hypothetical protein